MSVDGATAGGGGAFVKEGDDWKKVTNDFKLGVNVFVNDAIPDEQAFLINTRTLRQIQKAFEIKVDPVAWEEIAGPVMFSPFSSYEYMPRRYAGARMSDAVKMSLATGTFGKFTMPESQRIAIERIVKDPVKCLLDRKDREHLERSDRDLAKIPLVRLRFD